MDKDKKFIQDPNTPKYNTVTGLLTDYGKSLGLKEVNPASNSNLIAADTLTQTETPPIMPPVGTSTSADGLAGVVTASTDTNKADAAALKVRTDAQATAKSDLGTTLQDILDTNTKISKAGSTIDRTAEDKARKEADAYTSQIEAEQLANRRQVEKLQKNNPEGLFGGALTDAINNMNAKSVSKQADLAILQNSALRNYETANAIADRQLELKLEPLKTKLENLKFFYEENKADFNKEDDRIYNEAIKKADREYEKQTAVETSIKDIKLKLAESGNASPAVLAALSAIDTTKANAFDEVVKIAGKYMPNTNAEFREVNGNLLRIDKVTGKVLNNYGDGDNVPDVVARNVTVAGKQVPVTGYTTVAGDDPFVIAQQLGIDVQALKDVNPEIKDWNNIPVGATINVPQSEEDAFVQKLLASKGGKALTDTSIQKLDKGLTVLGQLGVLQANVENVETGPIVGTFRSKNPWDTKAQTIKAQLNAIVPNLARGIYGEVGVLTDNDIATYSKTIPNLGSTEEVRNAVLYITLDMIGKSIKNTLKVNAAAGRDVSKFVDIYTEMEAAKNSILQGIPNAQIPDAFNKQTSDPFLNQFLSGGGKDLSNVDFFNKIPTQ